MWTGTSCLAQCNLLCDPVSTRPRPFLWDTAAVSRRMRANSCMCPADFCADRTLSFRCLCRKTISLSKRGSIATKSYVHTASRRGRCAMGSYRVTPSAAEEKCSQLFLAFLTQGMRWNVGNEAGKFQRISVNLVSNCGFSQWCRRMKAWLGVTMVWRWDYSTATSKNDRV